MANFIYEAMQMTQSFPATDAGHVLTLEEITQLTDEAGQPADTLMNVVALIATRFRTDVCSAYLLEPDRCNLVLGRHPRPSTRAVSALCACPATKA